MWGCIFTDVSYQPNLGTGFSIMKSDVVMHLAQWQYWWWFWFTFVWTLYFFFLNRSISNRMLKFRPKIYTSYRSRGKWGDFLACALPLIWCLNILTNSSFILRLIEWQNESSLFTIRIKGRQWYWIYKLELRHSSEIISAPHNIGTDQWVSSTGNDLEINDNYYHAIRLRAQALWRHKYLFKYENEIFADEEEEELYSNTLFINTRSFKNRHYGELHKHTIKRFERHLKLIFTKQLESNCFELYPKLFLDKPTRPKLPKHIEDLIQYKDFAQGKPHNHFFEKVLITAIAFVDPYADPWNYILFAWKYLIYNKRFRMYQRFLESNLESSKKRNTPQVKTYVYNDNKYLYNTFFKNWTDEEILHTPRQKIMRMQLVSTFFNFNKKFMALNLAQAFTPKHPTYSVLYLRLIKKMQCSYNWNITWRKIKLDLNIVRRSHFSSFYSEASAGKFLNHINNINYENLYSLKFKKNANFIPNFAELIYSANNLPKWRSGDNIELLDFSKINMSSMFKSNSKRLIKPGLAADTPVLARFKFLKLFNANLAKIIASRSNGNINGLSVRMESTPEPKSRTWNPIYFTSDNMFSAKAAEGLVEKFSWDWSKFYKLKYKYRFNTGIVFLKKQFQIPKDDIFMASDALSTDWLADYYDTQNELVNYYNERHSIYEDSRFVQQAIEREVPILVTKGNIKFSALNTDKEYDRNMFNIYFNKRKFFFQKITSDHHFLVIKQKRFKRKKLIQMRSSSKILKKYKIIYKDQPELVSFDFVNHLKFKPTLLYRYVKKNHIRQEDISVQASRRLLRTRKTLVLPAYINLTLITNSYDVIHSWFVPALGIKLDCVPGRSTHHVFYCDSVGFYYGQCAEICGRYHHHMPIRICALPFEHFVVWWQHFGLPKVLNVYRSRTQFENYGREQFIW